VLGVQITFTIYVATLSFFEVLTILY